MSTIKLYGGEVFDFAHPEENEVSVESVAHALAAEQRYANHLDIRNRDGTRGFYSVAEHSVHVMLYLFRHCPGETMLHKWALAHDATEAVLRDIPGPAKDFIPGYRDLEYKVMQSMKRTFGLAGDEPLKVKLADGVVGWAERRHFYGALYHEGAEQTAAIQCWPPDIAKARFLSAWHGLESR